MSDAYTFTAGKRFNFPTVIPLNCFAIILKIGVTIYRNSHFSKRLDPPRDLTVWLSNRHVLGI